MLLLEVDVVHFITFGALLDVPATVAKMSGNFGLGKWLETVVADFCSLLSHGFKFLSNYLLLLPYIRNVK